jgi:hypothetical protein
MIFRHDPQFQNEFYQIVQKLFQNKRVLMEWAEIESDDLLQVGYTRVVLAQLKWNLRSDVF